MDNGATQSSSDVIGVSEVDSTPLDFHHQFDVQNELNPVAAKWKSVGVALRLNTDVLDNIETKHSNDPHQCLMSMVTEWLNRNYNVKMFGEPTWQKLVEAVGNPAAGANMACAREMARKHNVEGPLPEPFTTSNVLPHILQRVAVQSQVTSSPYNLPRAQLVASTHWDLNRIEVFAHENRQAIIGRFATFQKNVCDKLLEKQVDNEQLRLFVMNQFPPGNCIPPHPADITNIFKAITHHGLWDYFHYSPLAIIVHTFFDNDPEMNACVKNYEHDLKSYRLVNTVEDYIESDLTVTDHPPAKAKYDPRYYTPVEWKTKFIDHSLQYLTKVWERFSSHYLVPDSPPTALLDRVRNGCISVTWLIPSGLIPQLVKKVKTNTDFFQQYRITKVTVTDQCIYEEVTKERASAQHIQGQFGYRTVQLVKTGLLGTGTYGAVYKAICDDLALPCAYKILHSKFNTNDPGAMTAAWQFEQECSILRVISHPNIVQYLGTYRDPETQLQGLIMELMDGSLTQLLDQSEGPLPYHTQVKLLHDIALALAYLHSNYIIHRDLSSNNVLLVGAGIRAKVTDFGMAKEIDENCTSLTPLTRCPGTRPYMPPEAFDDQPEYTNKLDCFSFGVLGIQIITRQFPNPGSRTKKIRDARSPTGIVEMPILETERRKSHIRLVNPTHPLLRISITCLSYKPSERPSAQKLCNKIAEAPQYYSDSVQQAHERCWPVESDRDDREGRERHIRELQEQLQQHKEETNKLRQQYDSQIQEKDAYILSAKEEILKLQQATWEKDHIIEAKERHLQALNKQLAASECVIAQLQKKGEVNQQPTMAQKGKLTLCQWKKCEPAPSIMKRGSATVCDSIAYFKPFGSTQIQSYNSITEEWSPLPVCPTECVTLTVVKDLLTAVGGAHLGNYKNTLLSLVKEGGRRKWVEHFPPMPTERRNPAIICSGKALVVAGGQREWHTKLATVEVMDTDTLKWSSASSLPHPLSDATVTVCEDRVYLVGGDDQNSHKMNSVLTCSLRDLLDSQTAGRTQPLAKVWRIIEDLPVKRSTSVALNGQLLAVGGEDLDGKETNTIYAYNTETNAWEIISHMHIPRYNCLVTVLPDNKLMVVGGQTTRNTEINNVEITTVL